MKPTHEGHESPLCLFLAFDTYSYRICFLDPSIHAFRFIADGGAV